MHQFTRAAAVFRHAVEMFFCMLVCYLLTMCVYAYCIVSWSALAAVCY